ncbi:MAG TPA: hypothetical protein VMR98_04010 [Candidatus Polarisedimenticolaceae bacterium]|nr:hypothetical protein [Candidatus Polarisedimenticolaceae bacterium]
MLIVIAFIVVSVLNFLLCFSQADADDPGTFGWACGAGFSFLCAVCGILAIARGTGHFDLGLALATAFFFLFWIVGVIYVSGEPEGYKPSDRMAELYKLGGPVAVRSYNEAMQAGNKRR